MITLKRILVTTDFSEPSNAAFTYGRELARRFGAKLHVLHVAEDIFLTTFGAEACTAVSGDLQQQIVESAQKQLEDMVGAVGESAPAATIAVVTASSAAFAIVNYAKHHQIDLIVMGTHGRGALAHLVMGSVAERVVRLAPCPVLTVRHPEREFVLPDALVVAASA